MRATTDAVQRTPQDGCPAQCPADAWNSPLVYAFQPADACAKYEFPVAAAIGSRAPFVQPSGPLSGQLFGRPG